MDRKFLYIFLASLFIFGASFIKINNVYALGELCFDTAGTCGSETTPCTGDNDCTWGEWCQDAEPGAKRCQTAPGNSCQAPTCNTCANAQNQCGSAGLCNDDQQCLPTYGGGNYQCQTPNVGSCGNCVADGGACPNGAYECCSADCTDGVCGCTPAGGSCSPGSGNCCGSCVTADGGASWYCFGGGGGSCIGYGQICVDAGGQVLGGCCNNENCTAYSDGLSYCGDPFVIFDQTAVPPNEYSGPIVDYQSFITNFYQLLLPIAIGIIGIPLLIINGYKIMTSQGDPAKVKEGKEGITAVVFGLLFLLLALSILRIILNNFLGQSI